MRILQAINGSEKGEMAAMLLSPISRPPTAAAGDDSSRSQNGSQFTMFLTAPLQAFCFLIGISGTNIDKVIVRPYLVPLLFNFFYHYLLLEAYL